MKNSKLNSLVILPINLQLFAAGEDDSDNQEDVVGLPDDADESDYEDEYGLMNEDDEGEADDDIDDNKPKKLDVADPDKSKQSPEENEAFKKMRQKAKADVLKELETERARLDADKKEIESFKQQQRNTEIEQKYFSEVTAEVVEDFAYREGVTEDFAKKFLIEQAKNKAIQEIHNVNNRISQAQSQKEALKNKPYFKELEKDIDDLLSKSNDANITVETAYNYLRGVKLDELIEKAKSNTEKKTIANIQDKSRRRVSSSDSAPIQGINSLSSTGREIAIAMGIDPRDVAKHVKERSKNFKTR